MKDKCLALNLVAQRGHKENVSFTKGTCEPR